MTILGDIFGCHNWGVLLASSVYLNTLQCTRLSAENALTQNVTSAEVGRPQVRQTHGILLQENILQLNQTLQVEAKAQKQQHAGLAQEKPEVL